jgi:transposase-like protein
MTWYGVAIFLLVVIVGCVGQIKLDSQPRYCPRCSTMLHTVTTYVKGGYECEACKRTYDKQLREDPYIGYLLAKYRTAQGGNRP